MTAPEHPFDPDWVLAPAALLREWMAEHGLSDAALASRAARTLGGKLAALRRIQAILVKGPVTDADAELLAAATGTAASTWRNAERIYRDGLAAGKTDTTPEVP